MEDNETMGPDGIIDTNEEAEQRALRWNTLLVEVVSVWVHFEFLLNVRTHCMVYSS